MPEQLTAAGVSWKVYTGDAEAGYADNVLEFFKNFKTNKALAERGLDPTIRATSCTTSGTANSRRSRGSTRRCCRTSIPATTPRRWASSSSRTSSRACTCTKPGTSVRCSSPTTRTAASSTTSHRRPGSGHSRGVPHGSGHRQRLGRNRRADRPRASAYRCSSLALQPRRLPVSDPFDHTSLLRFLETRFGADFPNFSVATRSDGRPHRRVQLRPAERHDGQAPAVSTLSASWKSSKGAAKEGKRAAGGAAQPFPQAGSARMAPPQRTLVR